MPNTINKRIYVKAFGYPSGKQLFTLTFEPWFPKKKYYTTVMSLYNNPEFISVFGEEVGSVVVEEESPQKTERGFYEGMSIEICRKDTYSKLIDMPAGRTAPSRRILPFKKTLSA